MSSFFFPSSARIVTQSLRMCKSSSVCNKIMSNVQTPTTTTAAATTITMKRWWSDYCLYIAILIISKNRMCVVEKYLFVPLSFATARFTTKSSLCVSVSRATKKQHKQNFFAASCCASCNRFSCTSRFSRRCITLSQVHFSFPKFSFSFATTFLPFWSLIE